MANLRKCLIFSNIKTRSVFWTRDTAESSSSNSRSGLILTDFETFKTFLNRIDVKGAERGDMCHFLSQKVNNFIFTVWFESDSFSHS